MKTRSAPSELPNIAAGVKARRTARIGSPSSRTQNESQPDDGSNSQPPVSISTVEKVDEPLPKARQGSQKIPLKDVWTADDRRLFFQGVRLYGRNFNELARFIRSRGHRTYASATSATVNQSSASAEVSGVNPQSDAPTVVAPVAAAAGLLPNNLTNQFGFQSPLVEGRTKEQVRLFYQQTWHKLRRYIKYPDEVPQHVREVYAIINWSVMRFRIKKTLDNRLGEKLNELVHYGSTCVKHNGRRFLLRTPVCPILKQLNHISAPTQEFTLPDDVWVELVPATQMVAWRVLEAEQNPRLRLKTDINRQLSDVISLAEAKWILPTDLIQSLLCPSVESKLGESRRVSEKLLLRFQSDQCLDGAISLQEISRTRSTDIALNAYLKRRHVAQDAPKPANPVDIVGEGDTGAVTDNVDATTARSSAQEEQRQAGSSRTGSSPSSTAVHLDLHEVGKRLANGVTFEEARGIKLVVIYLALGCPTRIRFEYEFVQAGQGRTPASSYTLPLSKGAIANGEGITNGLRRLLHLSASEYLNLKSWNQPVRPATASAAVTTVTDSTNPQPSKKRATTVSKSSASQTKISAEITTPMGHLGVTVSQPMASPSTGMVPHTGVANPAPEFTAPSSRVTGGHEIFVVGEGQKQKAKMVVARQLNVQRPTAPPPSGISDVGLTLPPKPPSTPRPILPLPMPKVPIPPLHSSTANTTNLPVCKAATTLPTTSLHALRTFSQNQARRVRRHRMTLGALRRRKSVPVPTVQQGALSSPLPPPPPPPPPPPISSAAPSTVSSVASTASATVIAVAKAPALSSQSNHCEISLPFSIGACSNVSTSDSLKSLLNAFMANAPPGLELSTPTKEAPQPLSSTNFLHFSSEAQATTDMVHQEDSSSFSTFINTLTANHPAASHSIETPLSDSLQEKIYQDMMQPSSNSTLDLPLHTGFQVSGVADAIKMMSSGNGRHMGMADVQTTAAGPLTQEPCQ